MPGAICTAEDCADTQDKFPYCNKHYIRNRRYGDPLEQRHASPGANLAILKEAAATDSIACYIPDGRAYRWYVHYADAVHLASRAVWMIANGDPGELHVLHRCNGGSGDHGCININHLHLGTNRQNMDEKAEKAVHAVERHSQAILTNGQALEFLERYKNGETVVALSSEFGVHRLTGHQLVSGRTWARLPGRGVIDARERINPRQARDAEITRRYELGELQKDLAVEFGLDSSQVCRIVNRKAAQ